jgi:integrase/recombinase XerC
MSSHKQTELQFTDKANLLLKTMPDYVKLYVRAIHNRTSPRTRYEYLKDIQVFLEYLKDVTGHDDISVKDLSKLTKIDFEEYFEYLEHYEKNGREITNSRVSIKRKISSLRRFFGYLFENSMIPSDEIRKVEIPKISKKEIIRLDDNESADFIDAVETGRKLTKKQNDYYKIQSTRDLAIIFLLLSSGLRVSECAELDTDDIDINKCCVHVTRKGGDEAVVYFSDEAAEYLKEYLEYRKNIQNIPENEKALFLSSRKTRMNVRTIEIMVKKYAKRSVPLKNITPHKLRATYATNLYNETGDIYLVAETLGHNDVTTTKEHYASMSDKHKEENRNRVTFKKK